MPRLSYPATILALIQSTTYPPVPHIDELELLRQALTEQAGSVPGSTTSNTNLSGRGEGKKDKRKHEDTDGERERDRAREREKVALEANEKSGARLEAVERARMLNTGSGASLAGKNKASPGPVVSGAGVGSLHGQGPKVKRERMSPSPAPSNASSASFRLQPGSQPITYGQQMKKKKAKRIVESDDETRERERPSVLASPPPLNSTTSSLKLKLPPTQLKNRPTQLLDPSPTPSASAPLPNQPGSNIDFSLTPQPARPLVPLRPGIQKPPKPGPKRQSEVDEDFSNTKAPTQVAMTAFWSSMEAYIREIREDDLAMLNFKADAPESFDIPTRGKHYTELWDEEDGNPPGTTPRMAVPASRPSHAALLSAPNFTPVTDMKDDLLVDELRGLGNLTERIVAGMVDGIKGQDDRELKGDPSIYEGNREYTKMTVGELEERMKKELRGVMLLGEHEEYDPSKRDDDEITSSLRQCQRLLLQQTQINESRKARLAEVAKRRLAYGEYHLKLDGVEKDIEAGWAKRVKKYGTAPKRASGANANGTANGATASGSRPPIPESLRKSVQLRQHLLDMVGRTLRNRPRGEVVGMPESSIYDGIGEEMDAKDEKIVEDQVDVEVDEGG